MPVPAEKQEILQKALSTPHSAQSKIIIAKAKERGWLDEGGATAPAQATAESIQGVSKTESALRGAAQGATFGFGDKLSAGVEKGLGVVTGNPAYKGVSVGQLEQENQTLNEQAKAANPVSYAAGDVAGSLSTTAPLTMLTATKAAAGAGKLGKAAGSALKIGVAGAQGGAEGALRAAGEGGDGGKQGLLGLALGALGEGAAQTFGVIKNIGKNLAEEVTVKNIGFAPMALQRMREKGDLLGEAKSIGRTLLDMDVLDKPQSARMAHTKVVDLMKKTGKELANVYKDADKLVPDGVLNPNEVISVIEDKLLGGEFPDVNAVANVSEDISNLLTSVDRNKKMGFEKLWSFTKELEKRANIWGRASDPAFASKAENLSKAAMALRSFVSDQIAAASPELSQTQKALSPIYHDLSRAEDALGNKIIKAFSKNKSLPRQGLFEMISDLTLGSTPVKGTTAGLLDTISKLSSGAGGATRGLSQAAAAKGEK